MTPVPRLGTERLVLRGWRDEDHAAHAAIVGDPDVMQYLGGPVDEHQAWRLLALHVGHWELRGFGQWVVERRSDRTMIGRVGLWEPFGWPGTEIGWTLGRDYWGNGYVNEAANAVMHWAWTVLRLSELIALIHPDNVRSQNVALKLGFRPRGHVVISGTRVIRFGIDRPPGPPPNPAGAGREDAPARRR